MSFNPLSPERISHSLLTMFLFLFSLGSFTSASCVWKRVGIVGNGYTFEPQSYPSSLRHNLCSAGPGINGWTGLARGNADSEVCVQYSHPDQGPEGAGS